MSPDADQPSRLSVGLLSPGWPPAAFQNGIVSYVATLTAPLRAMGHRVAILAHRVEGPLLDGDVLDLGAFRSSRSLAERVLDALSYRAAPGATSRRLRARALVAGVRAMVSGRGVQVVELEESFGVAARLHGAVPVPVCVRLHGPWFLNGAAVGARDDRAYRERVRAEGQAIALGAGLSAPSRDVLERVRAFYGLALEHAEVIPNPVAPVRPDERWRLDASDGDRVLFVGRFDRHKGGDVVIEAFARVLRERPRARLVFVGPDRGCVMGDGRAWGLEELVRARMPGAVEGRFQWLGPQPPAVIATLRRGARVTVVASRYETFSYTAAEALAMGCPLVATRVGGLPELVVHGTNGLLCRGEDPEDLAEKILELMAAPERAAALGERAARDAERLLHPDVVAGQTVAFYRRVLARTAALPARANL